MASTIGTIVTEVRVRVEEATARKWSDADQIIPYSSRAERWLARFISHLPKSKRFRYSEDVTIAANASTYALTGLAKKFDWLVTASFLVGNVYIPCATFQDDDEAALTNLSLGGGVPVSALSLQDDTLLVRPTYGAARTLRIRYGWIPAIKTLTTDNLDTPAEYDGDVVQRALHFALSDAGLTNTKFEEEYAVRMAEIEDLERSRLGVSKETVVQRGRMFSRCR